MNTMEDAITITTYSMALGAIAMIDNGEKLSTIREAFQQTVDLIEKYVPDDVKVNIAGIIAEEYGD